MCFLAEQEAKKFDWSVLWINIFYLLCLFTDNKHYCHHQDKKREAITLFSLFLPVFLKSKIFHLSSFYQLSFLPAFVTSFLLVNIFFIFLSFILFFSFLSCLFSSLYQLLFFPAFVTSFLFFNIFYLSSFFFFLSCLFIFFSLSTFILSCFFYLIPFL